MTFELVVDGRELTFELPPLASLAEALRTLQPQIPDSALVLVEGELVRAGDLPLVHAQGAQVRTGPSIGAGAFARRLAPTLGGLAEAQRLDLLAAATALLEPDVLAPGEEPTSLLAPFAPQHDVAAVAALVRRETLRLARAQEPSPPVRRAKNKHARPSSAAARRRG